MNSLQQRLQESLKYDSKTDIVKQQFIENISAYNIDTFFGDQVNANSDDQTYNKLAQQLLNSYSDLIEYLKSENLILVNGYKITRRTNI
jgi:hypothetical protein